MYWASTSLTSSIEVEQLKARRGRGPTDSDALDGHGEVLGAGLDGGTVGVLRGSVRAADAKDVGLGESLRFLTTLKYLWYVIEKAPATVTSAVPAMAPSFATLVLAGK